MKVDSITGASFPLQSEVQSRFLPERKGVKPADAAPPPASQGEQEVNERRLLPNLEGAVGQANRILETYGTELRFSIHESSGEMLVKVINTKDDSVVREIPPERVLDFVADVKKMLGIIIDKFI